MSAMREAKNTIEHHNTWDEVFAHAAIIFAQLDLGLRSESVIMISFQMTNFSVQRCEDSELKDESSESVQSESVFTICVDDMTSNF